MLGLEWAAYGKKILILSKQIVNERTYRAMLRAMFG